MVGSRAAAHLYRGRPDWTVMDGLGQGLGKPCPEGSARVQGSAPCPEARMDGDTYAKVEVTRELSVGGGVAALLFTYSASHYLCLRTLDQVLTNRSGPRGAAPAGLS